MVEVLSELGKRTGIPSFYISFILSPLISNGAEALAAYMYSQKKTSKTINVALATLLGASIMHAFPVWATHNPIALIYVYVYSSFVLFGKPSLNHAGTSIDHPQNRQSLGRNQDGFCMSLLPRYVSRTPQRLFPLPRPKQYPSHNHDRIQSTSRQPVIHAYK